jgi:L-2-hydroxyglutarate oxidase
VPADVADLLRAPGTWRLARRYWRTEVGEVARSLWTARFVAALQRLVPDVARADLAPAGAGVRAQAVRADGSLVDDFAFAATRRTVHVINAPSPAATASLAIGAAIADRVLAV